MLSKIGSSLGKPLYADECTTQTSRISFARISNVIKIQDPKGRILEQQIRYEWKPVCQKCLQVGHSCEAKTAEAPPKKGQGQGQRKEWKPTKKGGKTTG